MIELAPRLEISMSDSKPGYNICISHPEKSHLHLGGAYASIVYDTNKQKKRRKYSNKENRDRRVDVKRVALRIPLS